MKNFVKIAFLVSLLGVLLFGYGSALGDNANAQTVQETVAILFNAHKDFPCVSSFQIDTAHKVVTKTSVPSMAYNEQIVAFAKESNMDVDYAQCFAWVWTFDRDMNALNIFKEQGSGSAKGHYVNRGVPCPNDPAQLCLSDYDRRALYYSDLNEIIYELGGQPAYKFINDAGRPVPSRWARYPNRHLEFDSIDK